MEVKRRPLSGADRRAEMVWPIGFALGAATSPPQAKKADGVEHLTLFDPVGCFNTCDILRPGAGRASGWDATVRNGLSRSLTSKLHQAT